MTESTSTFPMPTPAMVAQVEPDKQPKRFYAATYDRFRQLKTLTRVALKELAMRAHYEKWSHRGDTTTPMPRCVPWVFSELYYKEGRPHVRFSAEGEKLRLLYQMARYPKGSDKYQQAREQYKAKHSTMVRTPGDNPDFMEQLLTSEINVAMINLGATMGQTLGGWIPVVRKEQVSKALGAIVVCNSNFGSVSAEKFDSIRTKLETYADVSWNTWVMDTTAKFGKLPKKQMAMVLFVEIIDPVTNPMTYRIYGPRLLTDAQARHLLIDGEYRVSMASWSTVEVPYEQLMPTVIKLMKKVRTDLAEESKRLKEANG